MTSKSYPESTVVYQLHFINTIDQAAATKKLRDYSEFVAPWVLTYPWYYERFQLRLPDLPGSLEPHLAGSVTFGESVEDECYPEGIKSAKHTARLLLPLQAAIVLSHSLSPIILGAAVTALATVGLPNKSKSRRSRSTVVFRSSYQQPHEGPPSHDGTLTDPVASNEFVLRPCEFNRVQYARLRALPTPTGNYRFPVHGNRASDRLAVELGLKVCTGLDLLLTTIALDVPSALSNDVMELPTETNWSTFICQLETNRYFLNENPGSRVYKNRLEVARSYFMTHVSAAVSEFNRFHWTVHHPGLTVRHVLDLWKHSPTQFPSLAEFRIDEAHLGSPDDDSWLFITPDQLDSMLATRVEPQTGGDEADQSLMGHLNNFVSASSSFRGVEADRMKLPMGKRKPDRSIVTSDESSAEEAGANFTDSSDGYSERIAEAPVGEEDDGQTMADMMRSLMRKIDGHSPATIAQLNTTTNGSSALASCISNKHHSRDDEILSDDDDDDLANLYGPSSDLLPDLGHIVARSSSSSAGEGDEDRHFWSRKFKQLNSDTSKTKRSGLGLTSKTPIASAHGKTDTGRKQTTTKPYSLSSLIRSEQQESIDPVGVSRGRSLANGTTDAPPVAAQLEQHNRFRDYLTGREEELANEPANSGRYIPPDSACPTLHQLLGRTRDWTSNQKKARRGHGVAVLAEPEQEDSSESDDNLMTSSDSDDDVPIDHADAGLAHHVMHNLSASSGNHPSGPAAQLLAHLGFPVHQLAASSSANMGRR